MIKQATPQAQANSQQYLIRDCRFELQRIRKRVVQILHIKDLPEMSLVNTNPLCLLFPSHSL
jgi:hypothetical protein